MSDPSQVYINSHKSETTSGRATHRLRTVDNSAAYLLPHLQRLRSSSGPSVKLLDVGCGPGTITIDFARILSAPVPVDQTSTSSLGNDTASQITAIDYAPEPVQETNDLAAKEGFADIVHAQVADVHALPFPDDEFDVIHVSQVLQHLGDPVQALRELYRVVKPSTGFVACRETAGMTVYPDLPGLRLFWDVYGRLAQSRGTNPYSGARIHVWAKQAGFHGDRIVKSAGTWCYSTKEERQAWGQSLLGRIAEGETDGFAAKAVEQGFCTPHDLKVMRDDWQAWMEDDDGWYGIWHGEIVCWKD